MIPEVFRGAFFPFCSVLLPKTVQCCQICFECARRRVSLDSQVAQEFLHQTIRLFSLAATVVGSSGPVTSSVFALRMIVDDGDNNQRLLEFSPNDNNKRYSGLSTV